MNLATFDTIWLPKFSFWLLLKIWIKTGFILVLNRFWLFLFVLWFDVDIFAFWKTFDVDSILDIYKCFDVDLLGFSKIWLPFANTFWQHWNSLVIQRLFVFLQTSETGDEQGLVEPAQL